jgi:hypothetical protein
MDPARGEGLMAVSALAACVAAPFVVSTAVCASRKSHPERSTFAESLPETSRNVSVPEGAAALEIHAS